MELFDILRCPGCRGLLRAEGAGLACPACRRAFEVIHGIPDLRPEPPGGEPRHGEFCLEVIRRWPESSYRELLALYDRDAGDSLQELWARHDAEAAQRGERRWAEIVRYAADCGLECVPRAACRVPGAADTLPWVGGVVLDLGCGRGSALFALARRAELAVGLDILLTDLLLAKKRFAEAGIANAAFVCASALELPFADASFDLANATDVIEHVPDQGRMLGEAHRVLRAGGVLFFNSPNRFSVLSREPHVKLWGVGFLPRRWMEPYVRWRLGKPYRSKQLLGLGELRRLVREAFGPHFVVRCALPRGRLARALWRPAEAVVGALLPQQNVMAWKPPRC